MKIIDRRLRSSCITTTASTVIAAPPFQKLFMMIAVVVVVTTMTATQLLPFVNCATTTTDIISIPHSEIIAAVHRDLQNHLASGGTVEIGRAHV